MFRKPRTPRSITIPSELHKKIAKTCAPIEQVPSEVLSVRTVKRHEAKPEKSTTAPSSHYAYGA